MKRSNALLAAIIFLLGGSATGRMYVIEGPNAGESFDTSEFRHIGARGEKRSVEGPAVFLRDKSLCSPDPDEVWGKIAIGDLRDVVGCNHYDAIRALDSAGAAAFVSLVFYHIPGIRTYEKECRQNPGSKAQGALSMVVVDAFVGDLDKLRAFSAVAPLVLGLGPPHNEEFYHLFTSIFWVAGIRVLCPLCSFFTTWCAWATAQELRVSRPVNDRGRAELREASLVICVLEGTATAVVGLLLALGQSGPRVLCDEVHNLFFTMLTGVSMLASTLLMFTMREMLRAFEGVNRQTTSGPGNGALFWTRYRFRGACAAILFIGMDFTVGVGIMQCMGVCRGILYPMVGLLFMLPNAGIGCVFLFYAERLMRPLRAHLATRLRLSLDRDNSISGSNAVAKRIAAVTLGLKMNGVALLSLFAIEIWYFFMVARGIPNPDEYGLFVFLFALSRTGTAFCHVNSVRSAPLDPCTSGCCGLFSTRCFESRKVRRVVPSQASIDISEAVPSVVFDSGQFESSMSTLTVSRSELVLGSLTL
eukprot:CAMPEP_0172602172 /NCGR_PEP_ID=MMETSP1068-20121228/22377_1 /TAXON_ID=35684 /ORGANISM="Pseudopedinella elastica, Strain CCMP716" /LENGTH=530 /DNA_ID=CAMNT_0013403453 /DNA_START=193 /DNA_END=1785 /DNA_ORIENTATION=+